ncbi:MAG: hypothetical protein GJ676_20375 [Rhodobacteraceae bacterium]|nr:hypothetical protein [Paracoccaceae bacterium]
MFYAPGLVSKDWRGFGFSGQNRPETASISANIGKYGVFRAGLENIMTMPEFAAAF